MRELLFLITGLVIGFVVAKASERRDKDKVYNCVKENTEDVDSNRFMPTYTIAMTTGLPIEKVEFICYIHKDIIYRKRIINDKSINEASIYEVKSV